MTPWTVVNDTPVWRKPHLTVWFLVRWADPADRRTGRHDYCDKAGRLRTWPTRDAAQAAADRLNARETAT